MVSLWSEWVAAPLNISSKPLLWVFGDLDPLCLHGSVQSVIIPRSLNDSLAHSNMSELPKGIGCYRQP
jgi:hypothetical protein